MNDRFEILTRVGFDFENTATIDGNPVYFPNLQAALADLENHLDDTKVAADNDFMDEAYDPGDYLIHDRESGERFWICWNADKSLLQIGEGPMPIDEDEPDSPAPSA